MAISAAVASECFLGMGVSVVGLYLVLIWFLAMIYVPKVRKEIEDLLNCMTQNWVELQMITAFAYVKIGITSNSIEMITANDQWVFFNFFDEYFGGFTGISTDDYEWSQWSVSAFKNVFTVVIFSVGYLLMYAVLKIAFRHSELTRFFEFEIGQVLMKIMYFRVALSLFLEVFRLFEGGKADYNTGVVGLLSLLIILIFPSVKIIYLRMKYRSNLNSARALELFGSDYRSYQTCWREFHMITEQLLLLAIAGCLAFLVYQPKPQLFGITGCLGMFLAYSIIFKPLRYRRLNIEAWFSRALLLGIMAVILGSYYYTTTKFVDYGIGAGLMIWYLGKIGFTIMHLHVTFEAVKELMDKENPPDSYSPSLLKGDGKSKEKNGGSYNEEVTVGNTGRGIGESQEEGIQREGSNNSGIKKRIKRNVTVDSTPDSIDPRLMRKRNTRKKKNIVQTDQ